VRVRLAAHALGGRHRLRQGVAPAHRPRPALRTKERALS
jgi:hypothetical protein